MVTFLGTVFVVAAEIVLLCFDMTFAKTIPGWCLAYFGISLFIYQTMDALDGIHARNHKMSSPLGQLFDAGIDAPLHGFLACVHLESLKIGSSLLGFLYLFALAVFLPSYPRQASIWDTGTCTILE